MVVRRKIKKYLKFIECFNIKDLKDEVLSSVQKVIINND